MRKNSKCEALVLTVPEAGRLLGIGRNTAYAAARAGDIPTIRLGKRLVVPRDALQRMLAEAGRGSSRSEPTRRVK